MSELANKPDDIIEKEDWTFARQKNRELIQETIGHLSVFFRLTALSISASVVLIVGGSLLSILIPSQPLPVLIILSGIVSLLLGVASLFIYRSTLVQARVYISEPLTSDQWEAARRKIQYYMHENLNQVRWIFWLALTAMFLGFFIILSGAAIAIVVQNQLAPSIVVTLSGVLVEFLGATFLVIYKATMAQANDYVAILERINTVGMSVKLVYGISTSKQRDDIRAKMASEILSLHRLDKDGQRE